MNFYSMLAEHYNELFTLKTPTVDFVRAKSSGRGRFLDVGCGTGLLSHALSAEFELIEGVDLDETMISQARCGAAQNEQFNILNMLDLHSAYGAGHFDLITCLGNSIAHLTSDDEVRNVLSSFKDLLADDGVAIIQIVNFDRVIKNGEITLPFLETENVGFTRTYTYNGDSQKVEFTSSICTKEEGRIYDNCVELYPLLKADIESLILDAGFKSVEIYGDYMSGAWNEDSGPIIAVAYL